MELIGYHDALVRRGNVIHFGRAPTIRSPDGGVRIAVSFVGVCGTDLQILNGRRPDTAEILGHEGVGTVIESNRRGQLEEGTQVVFNPAAQLSRGRILGHNTPGIFQKYITLDSLAVDEGLVMPANVGDRPICGALVEPLAAIIYAYELISNRTPNLNRVAVFGGGPVGLLAATFLRGLGVNVLLVHPTQTRLETIASLKILSSDEMAMVSDVKTRSDLPFDAALICTSRIGASPALRQAIEIVRDGACIDLITNYPQGVGAPFGIDASALSRVRGENICGAPRGGRYLDAHVLDRRISFTGHRGTSHTHLERALRSLADNAVAYMKLMTHILPLRIAGEAVQRLSETQSHLVQGRDCIKLIIDMTKAAQSAHHPLELSRHA